MYWKVRTGIINIWNDSLHRNSFFLMASTGVMAVVGFFFWFVAAKLFSPESIGLAASLISVSALLSYISTLGFPLSLIRFIPTSKKVNEMISSAFQLTFVTGSIVSFLFILITKFWFSEIFEIVSSPLAGTFFALAIIIGAWQQIGNSVFIAFRQTHWVVLESLIYSLLKLIFLPLFVVYAGLGIYVGNYLGLLIALLVSISIVIWKLKINIKINISHSVVKEMSDYTIGTYIAGLISIFPVQILPVLITKFLGPASAAHFFLPLMMVNLLMIIPQANGQTLFASSSASPSTFRNLTIASIKLQLILVFVGIFGFSILGGIILSFFGESYRSEAVMVLRILSLAVIPVVINTPLIIRLRILKDLKPLNAITLFGSISILISCVVGTRYGIIGVAYGYLIGQIFTTISYLLHWTLQKKNKNKTT